jgi:PAS domain S-box-containing protein
MNRVLIVDENEGNLNLLRTILRENGLDVKEALQDEETLAQSENCYRDLVENTHDLVQSIAPDGHFVFANRVWFQTLGYLPEELPHLTIADVIHKDSLAHCQQLLNRVMDGEQIDHVEAKFLTKDGLEIFVEGSASPRVVNGRIAGTHGFFRNVTASKQVEKELDRSEDKYRVLVEQAPDAIFCATSDLRITEFNARACELSGYDRDELIQMSVPDFIRAEDLAVQPIRMDELKEGKTVVAERRLKRKDGTLVPVEVSARFLSDGRLQAIIRDITERKQAEAALWESGQRLTLALDASNTGLWGFNIQTRETFFSREWKSQIGYDEDEIEDRFSVWEDLLHSDDRERMIARAKAYAEDEWPNYEEEFRLRHKDGSHRWIITRASLIRDSDGKPLRLLGSHYDVTERKQAEDALRERENVLRLFVEHTPAAIAMFDRNMKYLVASRRYRTDFRLGKQTLLGRSHYEVFPEMPERWKAIHKRCMAGAVEKCNEDEFPRADGHLDWVRWEIHPWFETTGDIGGIILFSEVITERKQTEAALRDSEARLRAIIDTEPECVKLLAADGSLLEMNPAGLRMIEADSFQQVANQNLYPLVVEEFREAFRDLTAKTFLGESGTLLFQIKGLKGGLHWLETHSSPLRDASGKITALLGITRDMTESMRSEAALRESEESYRTLFQMAPDGVAVFDLNLRIKMTNGRAAEIYGYDNPAEMIGLSGLDIIAPQFHLRARMNMAGIIETGYVRPIEGIGVRKDGTQFAVETSAALIKNSEGQPSVILGVSRDISERKRTDAAITDLLAREQSGRQKAEVMRDTNIAIAQSLSLQTVLDTLLSRLDKFIPFDSANVMLRDGETRFVVGAFTGYERFPDGTFARNFCLDSNENVLIRQICTNGKSLLIADTVREPGWKKLAGADHVRCWLGVPLIAFGKVIGFYSFDNTTPGVFTDEHVRIAETFAAPAASAIQNAQLFQRGQQYAAELEQRVGERERAEEHLRISREQFRALSERLRAVREEEGTRIAREIHDELGGALTGLKWDLEGIEKALSGARESSKVKSVREKIPSMTSLIESTINTVRRISSELRPGVLDDLGLVSAIEWQVQQFQSRTGIRCEYTAGVQTVYLGSECATAVFRIFQEILTNIIRHAEATSVVVDLKARDEYLELLVKDNGRGITDAKEHDPGSLGLLGMRERALLVNGDVSITGASGIGTIVLLRVPLRQ